MNLLTAEGSYMWTVEKKSLMTALYAESTTGFNWAVGYHPDEAELKFESFAAFLECAGLLQKERTAWDHARDSVPREKGKKDFQTRIGAVEKWAWIDEVFSRTTDEYMVAGDMSDPSRRVDDVGSCPAVLGMANYMSYHFLEPPFISRDIEEAMSVWSQDADDAWRTYEKARKRGSPLPAAGLIRPFMEHAKYATVMRWVLELV
jgi:hypothetical protein